MLSAWQRSGIVYYRMHRYDDALTYLTQAIQLDPRNATAHNYLGITSSQKGWPEAALEEIQKAITINPNYADAHFNIAVIYATNQPPAKEQAQKHYKIATSLGATPDPTLEKDDPVGWPRFSLALPPAQRGRAFQTAAGFAPHHTRTYLCLRSGKYFRMNSVAEKTIDILAEVTESERVRSEPGLALFDAGLLDSLGIVTLIARLSEEFGIDISPAEFEREDWATPAKIVADLERRTGKPLSAPLP